MRKVLCVLAGLCLAGSMARADLTYSAATNGSTVVVSFTGGTGTWTVPAGVSSVGLLVVGGGGAGLGYGGGGGGGGFYENLAYGVTAGGSVSVTVGAGGAGGAMRSYEVESTAAAAGADSVFDAITSYGGKGGNWFWTGQFYAGYATGGTSGGNNQGGVGIVADQGADYGSGSGAGAKGLGPNGSAGGAGLQSSITGSWYAGGGGSMVDGLGGQGGGGAGGNPPVAGSVNTGGGGGGGWGVNGAGGGSGIVVVSYAIPEPGSLTLLGLLGGALLLRRKLRKA